MDPIISIAQEAHDEFVRAVQKVAGHDAKGLQEPLDKFHEAARAVDAYIQGELTQAKAALEAEISKLTAIRDALLKEVK